MMSIPPLRNEHLSAASQAPVRPPVLESFPTALVPVARAERTSLLFLCILLLIGCSTPHHQLAFAVPQRFKPIQAAVKDRDLLTSEWRSETGEVLRLLRWPNGPQFDRGPMVSASEEPILVARQATHLVHTQIFFGQADNAWVVHLQSPPARFVIYGKNISQDAFLEVLRTATLWH